MPTIQAERHATLAAALQELVGSGVNGAAGQVVAAEGGAGHQGRHLGHLGAARQVQGGVERQAGVAELHQAGVRQPGAGGQHQALEARQELGDVARLTSVTLVEARLRLRRPDLWLTLATRLSLIHI